MATHPILMATQTCTEHVPVAKYISFLFSVAHSHQWTQIDNNLQATRKVYNWHVADKRKRDGKHINKISFATHFNRTAVLFVPKINSV